MIYVLTGLQQHPLHIFLVHCKIPRIQRLDVYHITDTLCPFVVCDWEKYHYLVIIVNTMRLGLDE